MIYFYLQNQSYHVQMLGIVIREHRQPAFFCFCVFCFFVITKRINHRKHLPKHFGLLILEVQSHRQVQPYLCTTLTGKGRRRQGRKEKEKGEQRRKD